MVDPYSLNFENFLIGPLNSMFSSNPFAYTNQNDANRGCRFKGDTGTTHAYFISWPFASFGFVQCTQKDPTKSLNL